MSMMSGGGPTGDGGSSSRDYLTDDEIDLLMRELARTFSTEDRALLLLQSLRFPRELVPDWGSSSTPLNFWALIFNDLDNGVVATPYRRLIAAARSIYAQHPRFAALERTCQERAEAEARAAAAPQPDGPTSEAAQTATQPQVPEQRTCHLVAWIGPDEERTALEGWLTERGLDPQREWSTVSSLSYRLNQTDPHALDRLMSARPDFPWAIVPPGDPDYVLRFLHVEGPDGQRLRFNDVPSATPVSSVAGEVNERYAGAVPGADVQPTVVDHIGPNGSRRLNPDSTLGEEGITEGDRLHVAFERRAAAVNPLDRRDALFRVRNQLFEYEDLHPGFVLRPNSPALPTEYDIEFTQPSFGPPDISGAEPSDISAHQLSIVLPPEFPIVAPRVRWLSDIFHPNVYPTYESERLRERPYARGLVCLGTLSESYQPSLDFGELLATLVDIAGYRNYSVFVLGSAVDPVTGQPLPQGDFYDGDAARWALSPSGQERIVKAGGTRAFRAAVDRPTRYRFEVEQDVIELDA
jgi:hypothetical protein